VRQRASRLGSSPDTILTDACDDAFRGSRSFDLDRRRRIDAGPEVPRAWLLAAGAARRFEATTLDFSTEVGVVTCTPSLLVRWHDLVQGFQ